MRVYNDWRGWDVNTGGGRAQFSRQEWLSYNTAVISWSGVGSVLCD